MQEDWAAASMAKEEWVRELDVRANNAVPPGSKWDDGKRDWTLLPFHQLEVVVKVLEFGANKYARDNWMLVPNGKTRYLRAAFRHLIDQTVGSNGGKDKDSGLPHWAHAVCCLLFFGFFNEENK